MDPASLDLYEIFNLVYSYPLRAGVFIVQSFSGEPGYACFIHKIPSYSLKTLITK
jgi:hypothetical protein